MLHAPGDSEATARARRVPRVEVVPVTGRQRGCLACGCDTDTGGLLERSRWEPSYEAVSLFLPPKTQEFFPKRKTHLTLIFLPLLWKPLPSQNQPLSPK